MFIKIKNKLKEITKEKYFKYFLVAVGIIFVPYISIPLLIIYWYVKTKRISKNKKIIYALILLFTFVIGISYLIHSYNSDEEPQLTITEPNNGFQTFEDHIIVKGEYSPQDNYVRINGNMISTNNGVFEYTMPLEKGTNEIEIVSGKFKTTRQQLNIIRELTEEEKQAQMEMELSNVQAEVEQAEQPQVINTPNEEVEESQVNTDVVENTQEEPEPTIQEQPQIDIMNILWQYSDETLNTRAGVDIQYNIDSVTLTLEQQDFWDENHLIREGLSTFVSYSKKAFELEQIKQVRVIIKAPFRDVYGNENYENALVVSSVEEDFMKYNWENLKYTPILNTFQSEDFIISIHPALSRELDYDKIYLSF